MSCGIGLRVRVRARGIRVCGARSKTGLEHLLFYEDRSD